MIYRLVTTFKIILTIILVVGVSTLNAFTTKAYSGESDKYIYPVTNCRAFHFKYSYHSGYYWLTYPTAYINDKAQYLNNPIKIQAISDLSSLTEIVNEHATKFCEPPFASTNTLRDCNVLSNLSTEYLELNKDILEILVSDKNYCTSIIELLELQDKVEGLENLEDLLKLKKSVNPLKILTDKDIDKFIDHFSSCGGKKFSNKFIENMILITARDACIMPSPPGYLSWDEAKKIASEIASEYENMSLARLNNKLDEISMKTYMGLTKVATARQISELLEMETDDAVKVVENLKSFQKIQKVPADSMEQYISLVYQTNATFELAEKYFPDLFWNNAKIKLPKNYKRAEFDKYILPNAQQELETCLKEPKKRIEYSSTQRPSEEIAIRSKLEEIYCEKHQTCTESTQNEADSNTQCSLAPEINLLSDDPNYSDTQIIMECAYRGLLSGIENMLPVLIRDVDPEIEDEKLEKLSSKGWRQLNTCFEQKKSGKELLDLSSDEFKVNLMECAESAESKLVETFVAEGLKDQYKEYGMIDLPESQDVLQNFNNCANNSSDKAMLINCVKVAMGNTSALISGEQFSTMLEEQKSRLSTYLSLRGEKEKIKKIAKDCFQKGLDEVEGYDNFLEWNQRNGIEKLTKECTLVVEKYAVPKILISESHSQLNDISDYHGTSSFNIIAQASQDMLKVNSFPDQATKGDESTWAIAQAYEKFLIDNPDESIEKFIGEFQQKVESRAINKIHQNIFDQLEAKGKDRNPVESYADLAEILNPTCIAKLKDSLMNSDVSSFSKVTSDSNANFDIISLIAKGLHYLKARGESAYKQQLAGFSEICQNTNDYNSIDKILKSGHLNFIIQQQIQESVAKTFKELAKKSYSDELAKYQNSENFQQIKPFIENKYDEMLKLVDENILDSAVFSEIMFKKDDVEKFAISKLSEIFDDNSNAYKKLNSLVTEQLFSMQGPDSFSSEFTRIQLENNLGIMGHDPAVGFIRLLPLDASNKLATVEFLKRQWTPNNIKKLIKWDNIKIQERQQIQISLYKNMVLPTSNGTQDEVAQGEKKFQNDLMTFSINNASYFLGNAKELILSR